MRSVKWQEEAKEEEEEMANVRGDKATRRKGNGGEGHLPVQQARKQKVDAVPRQMMMMMMMRQTVSANSLRTN